MYAMINPYEFFWPVLCVLMMGQSVDEALEGVKSSVRVRVRTEFQGIFKQKEQFD